MEGEEIFDAALALTQKDRHDNYLAEVALFLSNHTQAKYVIIGQLSDDFSHIHTLVFMKDGQLLENYSYSLKGTPCACVLQEQFCFHPCDVAPAFPDDKELKEFNIDCYLGKILTAHDSTPLGITVLMDETQIKDPKFCEQLITVLSPAIEEEIQLLKL